jgi:hypothetical protein
MGVMGTESARQPGDISKSGRLRLDAKTRTPGNDHNQVIWNVTCIRAGHKFGVNGSDFHHRHCPVCEPSYQPGLPLGEV